MAGKKKKELSPFEKSFSEARARGERTFVYDSGNGKQQEYNTRRADESEADWLSALKKNKNKGQAQKATPAPTSSAIASPQSKSTQRQQVVVEDTKPAAQQANAHPNGLLDPNRQRRSIPEYMKEQTKQFEGKINQNYDDSAHISKRLIPKEKPEGYKLVGTRTAGYGHTNPRDVNETNDGVIYDEDTINRWFDEDIARVQDEVDQYIMDHNLDLNDNQYGALLDLFFNMTQSGRNDFKSNSAGNKDEMRKRLAYYATTNSKTKKKEPRLEKRAKWRTEYWDDPNTRVSEQSAKQQWEEGIEAAKVIADRKDIGVQSDIPETTGQAAPISSLHSTSTPALTSPKEEKEENPFNDPGQEERAKQNIDRIANIVQSIGMGSGGMNMPGTAPSSVNEVLEGGSTPKNKAAALGGIGGGSTADTAKAPMDAVTEFLAQNPDVLSGIANAVNSGEQGFPTDAGANNPETTEENLPLDWRARLEAINAQEQEVNNLEKIYQSNKRVNDIVSALATAANLIGVIKGAAPMDTSSQSRYLQQYLDNDLRARRNEVQTLRKQLEDERYKLRSVGAREQNADTNRMKAETDAWYKQSKIANDVEKLGLSREKFLESIRQYEKDFDKKDWYQKEQIAQRVLKQENDYELRARKLAAEEGRANDKAIEQEYKEALRERGKKVKSLAIGSWEMVTSELYRYFFPDAMTESGTLDTRKLTPAQKSVYQRIKLASTIDEKTMLIEELATGNPEWAKRNGIEEVTRRKRSDKPAPNGGKNPLDAFNKKDTSAADAQDKEFV